MAIHWGHVYRRTSQLNRRANVAGDGINIAVRVMDFGDAGHVLVSGQAADELRIINARLSESISMLGQCEAKHGRQIAVNSYCSGTAGTPTVPNGVQAQLRQAGSEHLQRGRLSEATWPTIVGCKGAKALLHATPQATPPEAADTGWKDCRAAR